MRVKPRARANKIEGVREATLQISVTAAPTDGEANAAVIATLAKALGVAKSTLTLARGHKSREKTVCISELSEGEIRSRLTAALPSD